MYKKFFLKISISLETVILLYPYLNVNENMNLYKYNLQTQILDLTDELELRKIREDELLRQQAMDSKHVIEEIEELRVSCLLRHSAQ